MNVYDTLKGVALAGTEAQAELRRADAVVHEVNGKIMLSRAPQAFKDQWQDVYGEWMEFSRGCALLREREPRSTMADMRVQLARGTDLKRRALILYQQWKAAYAPVAAPPVVGPTSLLGSWGSSGTEKVLKCALITAALLGGGAAAKALYDSFKKAPPVPPAPPAPALPPYGYQMMPMLPALPALGSYPRAFQSASEFRQGYEPYAPSFNDGDYP